MTANNRTPAQEAVLDIVYQQDGYARLGLRSDQTAGVVSTSSARGLMKGGLLTEIVIDGGKYAMDPGLFSRAHAAGRIELGTPSKWTADITPADMLRGEAAMHVVDDAKQAKKTKRTPKAGKKAKQVDQDAKTAEAFKAVYGDENPELNAAVEDALGGKGAAKGAKPASPKQQRPVIKDGDKLYRLRANGTKRRVPLLTGEALEQAQKIQKMREKLTVSQIAEREHMSVSSVRRALTSLAYTTGAAKAQEVPASAQAS